MRKLFGWTMYFSSTALLTFATWNAWGASWGASVAGLMLLVSIPFVIDVEWWL